MTMAIRVSEEHREAIAYGLGLFKAAYPAIEITEETPIAWAKALEDIAPKHIRAAFEWALRHSRYHALPAVAHVRERAMMLQRMEEMRLHSLRAELAILSHMPSLTQEEQARAREIQAALEQHTAHVEEVITYDDENNPPSSEYHQSALKPELLAENDR